MTDQPGPSRTIVDRCLTVIERLGNALPHPAKLFAMLAAGVLVLSWGFSLGDVSVQHPSTGETIRPLNLVSVDKATSHLDGNDYQFHGFCAVGNSVLVAMLGIGVAEGSGLQSPLLEGIVTVIFVLGALAGIVYGWAAGTLRSDTEVIQCMGKAMQTMGTYMVLGSSPRNSWPISAGPIWG